MKKTFVLLAVLIGVAICAGSYSDTDMRTAPGRTAPALSVEDAGRRVALDELRGDYVLLNFWSSDDALSRRDANIYSAWAERHPDSDLRLVSVNFDDSEALFHEIVKRDGLDSATQFHADSEQAAGIRRDYGLGADGYGSVLINPEGRIVARNPSAASLDAEFGK